MGFHIEREVWSRVLAVTWDQIELRTHWWMRNQANSRVRWSLRDSVWEFVEIPAKDRVLEEINV